MNNRQEMVEKLLEGFSALEQFNEPPEQVAPQFSYWLDHVASALRSAGMDSDLRTWNESIEKM